MQLFGGPSDQLLALLEFVLRTRRPTFVSEVSHFCAFTEFRKSETAQKIRSICHKQICDNSFRCPDFL